jgi:cohesin complex subunit SA-1/2
MDISNSDMTSTPVATGSRRKSGRAVKIPEKFIPDAPSSQQGHSNAKRKRGAEDVENDASNVEEDDEDSDETVESAEEEEAPAPRKKAKAPRKPAAKKPKVNGTVSHDEAPAVKLPSRPKKGKKVLIADHSAKGLYGKRVCSRNNWRCANLAIADVFTSGMNAEDVAGQFLTEYRDNKVATVVEMVNLVLKSAGCDLQVTEDDVEDPENVGGKLGDLQQEYQAVSGILGLETAQVLISFRSKILQTIPSLQKLRAVSTFEMLLPISSRL